MKYLLILLFPFALNAQTLDLSSYDIVEDSLIVKALPDTSFFLIETGSKDRIGKQPLTRYKATFITRKGGQESRGVESEILTKKELEKWLQEQLIWINNDINNSQNQLKERRANRDQIQAFIAR